MEQKGSFIGFTFDGIHSSQLGIFRTSNSDRYQIDLTPKMADITTDLQAATGLYYWGTSYGGREFSISYAFFGMTEKQLGQIKEIFGGKKIAPLIFDEEPYKVWSAKVTGSATAKYVCFSDKGARFYAGTGELQFTTYHPYAQSREEYLERYTEDYIPEWREANSILSNKNNTIRIQPAILLYNIDDSDAALVGYEGAFDNWFKGANLLTDSQLDLSGINSFIELFEIPSIYNNLEEWKLISRIPSNTTYGNYASGKYKLFNAGDFPMPISVYYTINATARDINLSCQNFGLTLKDVIAKKDDAYLLIDTYNNVAVGCDTNYCKTGNLYNEHICSGDFFQLPTGEVELTTPVTSKLEFKYIYF